MENYFSKKNCLNNHVSPPPTFNTQNCIEESTNQSISQPRRNLLTKTEENCIRWGHWSVANGANRKAIACQCQCHRPPKLVKVKFPQCFTKWKDFLAQHSLIQLIYIFGHLHCFTSAPARWRKLSLEKRFSWFDFFSSPFYDSETYRKFYGLFLKWVIVSFGF